MSKSVFVFGVVLIGGLLAAGFWSLAYDSGEPHRVSRRPVGLSQTGMV